MYHVILIDSHVYYIDDSADCSYHSDPPSRNKAYIAILISSLAVAVVVLLIVAILYLLYCRHGKKSQSFIELDELNDDSDHHDNTITDHDTVQPAQEAGGSGDRLQVGSVELTTPTESSESQCSKPTLQELINRRYIGPYHSVPMAVAECGKERSTLVGLQNYNSNVFETVA